MPVKVVNDPFCIDILFGQYQFNFHHTGFFEYHSNTIGLPDEYRVVIGQVLSEIIVPSNTTSVVANIKVVSTTSTGFFIQTFPLLVTDQGTDHEGQQNYDYLSIDEVEYFAHRASREQGNLYTA